MLIIATEANVVENIMGKASRFQNLHFWTRGTLFALKIWVREFKNDAIMLKCGTLVDWMNTWGNFSFLKIFIFGSL